MGRPTPETPLTLRNFRLPDDLYYKFEFIAEQNNRTVTGHLSEIMKMEVEKQKENQGYKDKDMRTKARREKIKTKAKTNVK